MIVQGHFLQVTVRRDRQATRVSLLHSRRWASPVVLTSHACLTLLQLHPAENDLMADLEVGLSHSGALATTNGRALDDSAREDQVTATLCYAFGLHHFFLSGLPDYYVISSTICSAHPLDVSRRCPVARQHPCVLV